MGNMLKHPLTYHHDTRLLFERLAHLPWSLLLDSGQMLNPITGQAGSQYGCFDIFVAEPFITLVTKGLETVINKQGTQTVSNEDPFLLLKNILAEYPVHVNRDDDMPFAGGAMGYFSYDLGRRIEAMPSNARPAINMPEMMIGIYDWAVVVDHRQKKTTLISYGMTAQTHDNWARLKALFDAPYQAPLTERLFEVISPVRSNLSKDAYGAAFHQVKHYISEGDCYQVNLAQRFSAKAVGSSWQFYQKLREISPAPFMSYMNLPLSEGQTFQVMSDSPERFVQVLDRYVETRPIKGTRPRSEDPIEDAQNAAMLQTSLKDRAENVMIVDLLRNDLSKTCDQVKVNQLFQLQSFANVHHLVSIVAGTLKKGSTAVDLLRGCFPGGSITGAPKLRAMQIIDELEPHRRGLYCGAIGYIGFEGNMDTNIAIRTAVMSQNILNFYAGGGVVADSELEKEYNETLDKASSFNKIIKYFTRL
jgi:para-aminobenzoate synthetase component I